MNFSSSHDRSPTGTLRSLIQETTVCPPSRGLFFACCFVFSGLKTVSMGTLNDQKADPISPKKANVSLFVHQPEGLYRAIL
jgi:hypothetical protein